jgi:hypothetical protein
MANRDPYTAGKSTNGSDTVPVVVVDCTTQEVEFAEAWLELVVSFEASTRPAAMFECMNQLFAAAIRAVPALGLTVDFTHARTEDDTVVLTLIPRNPAGAADWLTAVVGTVRREIGRLAAEQRVLVRVGRAA